MIKYRYTELLGVVETSTNNRSHDTPNAAKCAYFQEKKQNLSKRLLQKQKEVRKLSESLKSVNEHLHILVNEHPEEFV